MSQDLAELLAEPFARLPAQRVPESAPSRATQTPGDTGGALPLPVPATSIVGRDADIEATAALLRRRDVRLVTVTGMGGIGKSRLALEVAHRVQDDFPGGVVLVPLVEVPEPGLVITSIASRLGIRLDTTAPSIDVVADALAERGEVLLLLDNAEHVRDAADDLAALIGTCPGLTLLVTSRSRLRLVAEHDYPLAPLDVGPTAVGEGFLTPEAVDGDAGVSPEAAGSAAVRLFLDRARAARPGLDLAADPAQLAAVVELCRRLDGLPLAIELAAARVRLMQPMQLLERLDGSLDLPASRLTDLPDRQRTLRSTLDWSHELLTPAERDLVAQLSTFVSGMSLSAVEQVAQHRRRPARGARRPRRPQPARRRRLGGRRAALHDARGGARVRAREARRNRAARPRSTARTPSGRWSSRAARTTRCPARSTSAGSSGSSSRRATSAPPGRGRTPSATRCRSRRSASTCGCGCGRATTRARRGCGSRGRSTTPRSSTPSRTRVLVWAIAGAAVEQGDNAEARGARGRGARAVHRGG